MSKFEICGIKDKIVCKEVEQEKMTKSGLIIPETANHEPQLRCRVISVGEEVKGISPDDIILCHRNAGMSIMIDEVIMKILKFDEVYCVLKTAS